MLNNYMKVTALNIVEYGHHKLKASVKIFKYTSSETIIENWSKSCRTTFARSGGNWLCQPNTEKFLFKMIIESVTELKTRRAVKVFLSE